MADDTRLEIDLDPKKVISAMTEMSEKMKELSKVMENSLSKDGKKAIDDLEDASEKGSNRIGKYFSELGKKIREDLKTAFDITKVGAGLKMGESLLGGIKSVFDMERAFDRLNTRLGMSNKALAEFKKNMGTAVAATGQKLEDVLPGVEVAASKGSVKDAGQLTAIGEQLARAKAITGEGTEGLSNSIVDILHNQGQKVNADNFKSTMDALQGARTQGAFRSAGDAANAMKDLTHGLTPAEQAKMGLDSRTVGGLAAVASKSGDGGIGVMQKILQTGQSAGGKNLINSIFGSGVFGKDGKISAEGLGNINKDNLGQFSSQAMADATGMDQAELARFIDSFKNNMDNFQGVVNGANETATQFDQATDNFASKFEKFKEMTKEATRQVGSELSQAVNSMFKGDGGGMISHLGSAAGNAWDNKGVLAGAVGTTALGSVLMGGGMNALLKKVPGGKLLAGAAGDAAADALGVQKVYVVNAAEIGGGGGFPTAAGGAMGKLGSMGMAVAGVAGAGAAGYGIGQGINALTGNNGQIGEMIYDWLNKSKDNGGMSAGEHASAVEQGMKKAMEAQRRGVPTQLINPSDVRR